MLGLLVDKREMKEMEYLLKRELDELLFDFSDGRIDYAVKKAMEDRYKVLFRLFQRVADPSECSRYIRKRVHN